MSIAPFFLFFIFFCCLAFVAKNSKSYEEILMKFLGNVHNTRNTGVRVGSDSDYYLDPGILKDFLPLDS